MGSRKVFIQTHFNTIGFSYSRETDPCWLEARLDIMRRYTAASIKNQSNQDFQWHILIRPETEKFIKEKIGFKLFNSYLISPEESEKMIKNAADYCETFFIVRLNSDDCYEKNLTELIHTSAYKPGTEALVFQNGFMWYQKENIIIEREFASPPFYAFIYNSIDYISGKRYDIQGHNYIRKQLKTLAYRERLWLWLVNDFNNKILRGSSYPDPSAYPKADLSILKDFGL